ncbi:hypothetical protein FBQ97_00570 [Acidobacteria bacterium ACD]|nr:hypothetical protein [Acidobacteria bacterium ACD]
MSCVSVPTEYSGTCIIGSSERKKLIVELHVENIAIIESAGLSLGPGFTVLTGETGAGKSLIADAIELALGARADSDMVRAGASRALVAMTLDLSGAPSVASALEKLGIVAEEGLLYLQREVFAEGKSQARINGRPAPLSVMREVGRQWIDLHGQHADRLGDLVLERLPEQSHRLLLLPSRQSARGRYQHARSEAPIIGPCARDDATSSRWRDAPSPPRPSSSWQRAGAAPGPRLPPRARRPSRPRPSRIAPPPARRPSATSPGTRREGATRSPGTSGSPTPSCANGSAGSRASRPPRPTPTGRPPSASSARRWRREGSGSRGGAPGRAAARPWSSTTGARTVPWGGA